MTDDLVTLPDGRGMQYWRSGAAPASPVILLPGTPDSRLVARSAVAAASRAGVDLIAINRPGYGRSDPAESDHVSVAGDVVAIADKLGLDRFAVLGMSLGGPYALACAAEHPQRVTAVGVVAAPGIAPEMDPPWHRDDLSRDQQEFFSRLATGTVAAAVEAIRPDFEAYIAQLAPDDTDDVALAGRLARQLHPLDAEATAALPAADVAAATREALTQTDGYLRDAAVTFRRWEFRLDAVRCPTWLWYGELDVNAQRSVAGIAGPWGHPGGPAANGASRRPHRPLGRHPAHPGRRGPESVGGASDCSDPRQSAVRVRAMWWRAARP